MQLEPGRRSAYSDDIRWRIIWQKVEMGLTFRRIAANLNVSLGTVHNIWKRFDETGSVKPKPLPHVQRIITDEDQLFIIGVVLDNPGVYLREISSAMDEVLRKKESVSIQHMQGVTKSWIYQKKAASSCRTTLTCVSR